MGISTILLVILILLLIGGLPVFPTPVAGVTAPRASSAPC